MQMVERKLDVLQNYNIPGWYKRWDHFSIGSIVFWVVAHQRVHCKTQYVPVKWNEKTRKEQNESDRKQSEKEKAGEERAGKKWEINRKEKNHVFTF